MHPEKDDPICDTDEAATYVYGANKKGKRNLEDLRVSGGGPRFLKISHRVVRYRISDLDAWLDTKIRTSTCDTGAAVESEAAPVSIPLVRSKAKGGKGK